MFKFVAYITIILTFLAIPSPASDWRHPISQKAEKWQASYLAPETEYGPGHRGVDMVQDLGSMIKAPITGSLYFAVLVVDRQVVTIRSAAGYLASFEPACTNYKVGDALLKGEEFAWHCPPSQTYEYHCEGCIHFSIRSQYGYLSPDYFLGELKPSVLVG